MELKKEFFQEADKAISEFDSIYDFIALLCTLIVPDPYPCHHLAQSSLSV